MTGQLVLNIETVTWMCPVNVVNSEIVHLAYAKVADHPSTLIVVEERTGSSRYYCQKHQMIYWPFKMGCPGCNNAVREQPNEAGVTPRDTPEIEPNPQSR